MKVGAKTGFLAAAATAVLAILPLGAGAQTVEVPWRSSTFPKLEFTPQPLYSLPGEPMPEAFSSSAAALRLYDSFEDSDADWERRRLTLAQCGLLSEIRGWTALDVIVGLPNGIMDWVTDGLRPTSDRDEVLSMLSPAGLSLMPRVFSCPITGATVHPFDDLLEQILLREVKYLGRFQDYRLSTFAAEESPEDIDTGDLMRGQQRVLVDAGRKLYFARYSTVFDARFRAEVVDFSCWQTVDFVIAPSMVAAYLYLFGWEQKFNLWGLRCAFQIEPVRQIRERHDGSHGDLVSAAGVEIGVGNFPLKVIVSAGLMDGDALIDFVGVGTSLSTTRHVVARELSYFRFYQ